MNNWTFIIFSSSKNLFKERFWYNNKTFLLNMKDFPQNNYYSRSGSIVSPPYPPWISVVSSFLLSSSPGLSSLLPHLRAEKTQRKYGRNTEMINRFQEATSQFPLPYSFFKNRIIFVPVLINEENTMQNPNFQNPEAFIRSHSIPCTPPSSRLSEWFTQIIRSLYWNKLPCPDTPISKTSSEANRTNLRSTRHHFYLPAPNL